MKTCSPVAAPQLLRIRIAVLSLLVLPAALATGSQAALLNYDSGRVDTARVVEQVVREGDPWEQLEWTFTVRPSLLYRRYLDERGGDLFSPRLSATLQVRFGETPLQSLRRALKLERALRAHDRAGRLEIRSALLAHAELLLSQDSFTAAEAALAALSPDADELSVRSAQLAAESAQLQLDRAQADAAAYGHTGPALYRPLRFVVPPQPVVEELSLYRQQELQLAEAELRYLEAGLGSVLRDFRVGGAVRTDAVDLDVEVGLMAGRPGLRVGTIHPGGRARMELRVSASFTVGDSLSQLPQLAAEVELARAELADLAERLRADWLTASEDAQLAEAELDQAELEHAAAVEALMDAQRALNELPEDAEARDVERLATAVSRAEREVQRLKTRVHRAWITYVRRHFDQLEASGGSWQKR